MIRTRIVLAFVTAALLGPALLAPAQNGRGQTLTGVVSDTMCRGQAHGSGQDSGGMHPILCFATTPSLGPLVVRCSTEISRDVAHFIAAVTCRIICSTF